MTTQQSKPIATKTEANNNAGNTAVMARPSTPAAKPVAIASKPAAAPAKTAQKKAEPKKAAAPKKAVSPYAKLTPSSKPATAFKQVHSAFPPQLPGSATDFTSSIQQAFSKFFPAASGFDKAFSESAREFSKNQQQLFGISSDSISQFTKGTEQATSQINDAINASRDNIEALIECGNIATGLSKSIGNKLTELANDMTAQSVNAAQQFLSCRTASDILNLQNEYIRTNVDNAFNNSLKIAELLAQFAKVAEPINERIASATEQFARKRK